MRIRQPSMEPPVYEAHAATSKTFSVQTITPMLGGGVNAMQPDKEMPVRASAIRGQLRYWWRLLNRNRYPNSRDLFTHERAIWGGMAQSDEDYASKVRISVETSKPPQIEPVNEKVNGYALFPVRDKNCKWIKPGYKFNLVISCNDEVWAEVEPALRWWATFGGLGTRSRRGMGKVRVNDLAPVSEDEAEQHGCRLVVKLQGDSDTAWGAVTHAIDRLSRFRQGEDVGRNPGNQPKRPGRSRWPEPDSIRQITGKHASEHPVIHPLVKEQGKLPFPRACFGMPIIFEIRGRGEPPKHSLQPKNHERMASPIILFAYPDGAKYRPAALLLPTDHLQDLDLELKPEGRGRDTLLRAGQWWPQDNNEACNWADQIRPMKGRDCEPLQAFLKYFGEQ